MSFLRGDPGVTKSVSDWKVLNTVPKEWKEKYTLSHRERQQILDEISYLDETLGEGEPAVETEDDDVL